MALHNSIAVLLHPLNDTVPGKTVKPKPTGTCPANAEANNRRLYEDRTWHLKFSTSATVKTKLHAGDSANIELADRVPDEASGLLHGPRFGSRARLVVSSTENGRNGKRNRAKPVRYHRKLQKPKVKLLRLKMLARHRKQEKIPPNRRPAIVCWTKSQARQHVFALEFVQRH